MRLNYYCCCFKKTIKEPLITIEDVYEDTQEDDNEAAILNKKLHESLMDNPSRNYNETMNRVRFLEKKLKVTRINNNESNELNS